MPNNSTSKYISLILRHKPEVIGITLDEHGWANVDELLVGVSRTHPLDMTGLEEIVRTDEKQRYSFNEDKTKIRANQGHSVPVDVELEEVMPPEILYHGTGEKYVASIADLIHEYGGLVTVHAGSKSNSLDEEMRHESSGPKNVDLKDSLGPVKDELLRNYIGCVCLSLRVWNWRTSCAERRRAKAAGHPQHGTFPREKQFQSPAAFLQVTSHKLQKISDWFLLTNCIFFRTILMPCARNILFTSKTAL